MDRVRLMFTIPIVFKTHDPPSDATLKRKGRLA